MEHLKVLTTGGLKLMVVGNLLHSTLAVGCVEDVLKMKPQVFHLASAIDSQTDRRHSEGWLVQQVV